MTKIELEKLVHVEFIKAMESNTAILSEKIKEYADNNGKLDSASVISLCISTSSDIAADALSRILVSALKLDD